MKRLLFAAMMLATPAYAQEPTTLMLPTSVILSISQYLSQRPYADVAQMIAGLQACISVQVPNAQGAVVSHGECPAVTAALNAKENTKEPATKTPITPPK
jgi:hypothetical protein